MAVDSEGGKHVLGIAEGANEDQVVAKGLLGNLVARGLDPKRKRLFVIDGSKALRAAIDAVFGAITLCVVSGIVIAPWLIRNFIVFHGQVLYSTHTGANLLEGIITPEGRGQPGEIETIRGKLGWVWQEMETNGPERLALPSEFELNRHALPIALQAWRDAGISALWVICKKLGSFWISTDQLIDTLLFPPWQRALRIIGVLIYWLVLLLAVRAWFALRKTHPNLATTLLVYVVATTILHFPFVMNTRLRVPLIDPLLCILAGHLGSTADAP